MEAELQHRIQSFLTPEPMSRQDSVASSAYSYYDHPTTVKMEDLQTSPQSMSDIPTPRPSGEHSRQQPKKRKSWGQVLPEPKTSLPPRKRAKTADEKEQRRIERVKRNRLAAHNSRERKRQEYDVLLQEKEELEIKLQSFEQAMKDMAAELQAYRSMAHGQPPSTSGLGITNVALPTTGISSYMNMNNNVVNPQSSFSSQSFPSPESMRSIDSVESPMNTITQPTTPEPSSEPDQTQHSAVMLWDLQCRSDSRTSPWAVTRHTQSRHLSTLVSAMSTVFLYNLHISVMTLIWTLSSTFRPSTMSHPPTPSSSLPSTPSLSAPSTLVQALMRGLMVCKPTLAQRLSLATGPASRPEVSSEVPSPVNRAAGLSSMDRNDEREIQFQTSRLLGELQLGVKSDRPLEAKVGWQKDDGGV